MRLSLINYRNHSFYKQKQCNSCSYPPQQHPQTEKETTLLSWNDVLTILIDDVMLSTCTIYWVYIWWRECHFIPETIKHIIRKRNMAKLYYTCGPLSFIIFFVMSIYLIESTNFKSKIIYACLVCILISLKFKVWKFTCKKIKKVTLT